MTPNIAALRQLLIQHGFIASSAPVGAGERLTKQLRASEMPYVLAHIVDGSTVGDSDIVVIEVSPDNQVSMKILNTDYSEETVPLESEIAKGILMDAGVNFDA